jgi:hypothetical protein
MKKKKQCSAAAISVGDGTTPMQAQSAQLAKSSIQSRNFFGV